MNVDRTRAAIDHDGQWHREGFLSHLEWERDLAAATLVAYRREVTAMIDFLVFELGLDSPALGLVQDGRDNLGRRGAVKPLAGEELKIPAHAQRRLRAR